MQEEQTKIFDVDGILLSKEDDNLIMKFKVSGIEHMFKITPENAYKMAEVLQILFLKNN